MESEINKKLVCLPSDVPVERVLGLQAFVMTSFPLVRSMAMRADDPRRRGFAVHYETLPLEHRRVLADDITTFHDNVLDQDVFMSFRICKPHSRKWRIGARVASFVREDSKMPSAQTLRYAFEWHRDDDTVSGMKRLQQYGYMQPLDYDTNGFGQSVVKERDGIRVDFSTGNRLVTFQDESIDEDDVNLLERYIEEVIKRKSEIAA